MTCSVEFPCYSTIATAVEQAVRESTIPAPPPEDDGSTLHTMTLDVARETIEVLKEREAEMLEIIKRLEIENKNLRLGMFRSDMEVIGMASRHADRIHQLETELAQLRAERR